MKKNQNKKMFLASSILLAGVLVVSAEASAAKSFTDFGSLGSHSEAVHHLNSLHAYDYKAGNKFNGNASVTRAEVSKILYTLHQDNLSEFRTYDNNFKDVTSKTQFAKEMIWSYEVGIFDGDNGKFNPKSPLTRAQLSKILVNTFNLESTKTTRFKDVATNHWAFPYVSIMGSTQVTTGDGTGNFLPQNNVTLNHLSSFIYRIMNRTEESLFPFEYTNPSKYNVKPGVHWNWSSTINDFIFNNSDDTFSTVEVDKNVTITTYNSQSKKVSEKKIALELPLFGTFYSGEKYNYIAYGRNNPKEQNVEVIRVVKYDKNFKRIAATSILGNQVITTIPFSASSGGRMAEHGDTLAFHTSRQRYKGSDGLNHQSQLTIEINTPTMAVTNTLGSFQENHVSHSFDQYALIDKKSTVYLDHGDAFPRSLVLHKSTNTSSTESDRYLQKEIFNISGRTGDNFTGVSIGGFEQSSTHYLVAFNTIDQKKASFNNPNKRIIYLSGTSKNLATTKDVFIADYTNSKLASTTPTLVKITDDRFIVLWQEYTEDKIGNLKYVYVNEQGKKTSSIYTASNMELSTVQPIVKNNKLIWYTSSNGKKVLYNLKIK